MVFLQIFVFFTNTISLFVIISNISNIWWWWLSIVILCYSSKSSLHLFLRFSLQISNYLAGLKCPMCGWAKQCASFKFSLEPPSGTSSSSSVSLKRHDCQPDWHTDIDWYTTEWFLPLHDKLLLFLGHRRSVKRVNFTQGACFSYKEGTWTSHLAKFGLTGIKASALTLDLVASCLNEQVDWLRKQCANSQLQI